MALVLNIAVERQQRVHDGQVVGRSAVVTGEVLRDGEPVAIDWPIVIVNPPEMVPDGDGFRHDPDEAIREVVRQVAG